ncbi:hypothetical protein [Psychrobacillus sp. L4]|uniref:hypothetical protein n=1 Tax=Psychrobacillus sp. L4 TaxID=3236892 RepID=UPI0036F352E7
MNQVLAKIIYFVFVIYIFITLWKYTGVLWNAYVPWNVQTDLLTIFVVTPILIAVSFILSSLSFKVIRSTN